MLKVYEENKTIKQENQFLSKQVEHLSQENQRIFSQHLKELPQINKKFTNSNYYCVNNEEQEKKMQIKESLQDNLQELDEQNQKSDDLRESIIIEQSISNSQVLKKPSMRNRKKISSENEQNLSQNSNNNIVQIVDKNYNSSEKGKQSETPVNFNNIYTQNQFLTPNKEEDINNINSNCNEITSIDKKINEKNQNENDETKNIFNELDIVELKNNVISSEDFSPSPMKNNNNKQLDLNNEQPIKLTLQKQSSLPQNYIPNTTNNFKYFNSEYQGQQYRQTYSCTPQSKFSKYESEKYSEKKSLMLQAIPQKLFTPQEMFLNCNTPQKNASLTQFNQRNYGSYMNFNSINQLQQQNAQYRYTQSYNKQSVYSQDYNIPTPVNQDEYIDMDNNMNIIEETNPQMEMSMAEAINKSNFSLRQIPIDNNQKQNKNISNQKQNSATQLNAIEEDITIFENNNSIQKNNDNSVNQDKEQSQKQYKSTGNINIDQILQKDQQIQNNDQNINNDNNNSVQKDDISENIKQQQLKIQQIVENQQIQEEENNNGKEINNDNKTIDNKNNIDNNIQQNETINNKDLNQSTLTEQIQNNQLGDLLFEDFLIIGPDIQDIEQQYLEQDQSSLNPKILYNYNKKEENAAIKQLAPDLAFPFGLNYKKKGKERIQKVRQYVFNDENCQIKKSFLSILKSDKEWENNDVKDSIQQLNPHKNLYLIYYQFEDYIYPSQVLNDRKKHILQIPVVFCFVTYYPLINFFVQAISHIKKFMKMEKVYLFEMVEQKYQNKDEQSYQIMNSFDIKFTLQFFQSNEKIIKQFNELQKQQILNGCNIQWSLDEYYLGKIQFTEEWDNLQYHSCLQSAPAAFANIPYDDFVIIFLSIIFEKKIVFFSTSQYLLTNTVNFFSQLIKPFIYPFSVLTTIHEMYIDYIETIVPIILGINIPLSGLQDYQPQFDPEDYVLIDLDIGELQITPGYLEFIYQTNPRFIKNNVSLRQKYQKLNNNQSWRKIKKKKQNIFEDSLLQKPDKIQNQQMLEIIKDIEKLLRQNIINYIPINKQVLQNSDQDLDHAKINQDIQIRNPGITSFLHTFLKSQTFVYYLEQFYKM